ncbi:MAG: carboxypeptidase regulatory-like domain-containing protein [Chitinispirillaceae bacterium]|nr:carboxypeptidase regulatory-like domain-containing protein [Chitinispirillaceae bacterium]
MAMHIKEGMAVVLAGLCVSAQQSTDYLIVEAPIGVQAAAKTVWVKWTGISRGAGFTAPDSGTIYYDRSPGGGKLANYRYSIAVPYIDTSISTGDSIRDNVYFSPSPSDPVAKRGIAFRATDQPGMGFGAFYCVVALPLANDTLVSNEFQLIIESPDPVDWTGPSGTISSMTPTFRWNANPGVPYYHIILSDDIIKIDSSSGEINLQGLSIIWQAITPATQMVYGAPDPSRTITADPPPLSPGQNYTWVVLNNYGNHMAFSSMKVKLPPGEFTVTGTSLNKPECIYPKKITLTSTDDRKVFFKWKNLDSKANTYKIYIYVGSDFEGINAQLVVYQTEVVADGRSGADEADSVEIDAASVLTSNKYTWRVIAVNDRGAGTVGDTAGFHYKAPTGTMVIYTKEQIVVGSDDERDTVVNPVGLVELKVEVLDGSLEAPLLFYTDDKGFIERERPVGTYRVTAIKSEFEQQSRTMVVGDGETATQIFYLERPDATVYGKVLDRSDKGINLAQVYGVSDRGDTVTTKADALGGFVLNCYTADWRIGVSMEGYQPSLPRKITVLSGENYDFGSIVLEKNPFTLSGTVKNSRGDALLGVRVRLYKDGTLVGEVPSTPQNGAFSFTVPSGTYAVVADKTGFTSYSKSIDVMSSRAINVTLEPGATLVTGYVYGKTWVGESRVIAPITGAKVLFVRDGSTDTVSVLSDPTYGDFRASLAGGKQFEMYSSAEGFVEKSDPVVFTTELKATQTVYDTLQGLGMLSGIVTMSSNGIAVGNANVSLVDIATGSVAGSGKSGVSGDFELRGIPDGSYLFRAGKEGLVLDSVGGKDTVAFAGGKAGRSLARIYLKPGDKTIRWRTAGSAAVSASVKMQSPIVKTIPIKDSLVKTGSGLYVVSVDAGPDSILDLSYHRFTVADSEVTHIDTVDLSVVHTADDTLVPEKGGVSLSIRSGIRLDSVALYYKDAVAAVFAVVTDTADDSSYAFSFVPPRDGSTMMYYFKAWRGSDAYGYDREAFTVFIAPDRSMLTRFEIAPASDDTLSFPSQYEATFELKGYVSSTFIVDTTIAGGGVSWSLNDAQGAVLSAKNGLKTKVTTGTSRTSKPVVLTVSIDTSRILLAPGLANGASLKFNVTGSAITTIAVTRTDAANPSPISTASTDLAEFSASGMDAAHNRVDLIPKWAISPPDAGTISASGVFRPLRNFAGMVRILASVGSVTGEYRLDEQSAAGLNVRFMITDRASPDTVNNRIGCSIVLPPHVVRGGDIGLLEIANTVLVNQFKRGFGAVRSVDTLAFEIRQLENVTLDLSADSIRLNLAVPKSLQRQAASGKQHLSVAQWIEDSLLWRTLANSRVSSDGAMVSAGLTHFSRYCIVYEPADALSMDIAPNPFSPYIVPHYNPFDNEDRVPQRNGTCIRVRADIREARTEVRLRIYNILGDQVWSLLLQNADNLPYYLWWDGRTSRRELLPSGNDHVVALGGDTMCRNGRYFAVVTASINGKEQRKMKQIVLMK